MTELEKKIKKAIEDAIEEFKAAADAKQSKEDKTKGTDE